MNKIIPLNSSYIFILVEDSSIKSMHPISNYYCKLNDLSVNVYISLKWILWAHFFLTSLSTSLINIRDYYDSTNIIGESINNIDIYINNAHILILDDKIIKDSNMFHKLIEDVYIDLDENTKIHFKLKVNLYEYLLVTNNTFPLIVRK